MSYVGTCVVCGEAITHVVDLAWVAPLSLGGPRRRAHARVCAYKADVQAGPRIEGGTSCPTCGRPYEASPIERGEEGGR